MVSTCTPCSWAWCICCRCSRCNADYSVERDEYNKNVRSAFERMRDFQRAHYLLNRYGGRRSGSARGSRPSAATSRARSDAFRARGEAVHYEDEAFTIDDWQALFIGHGVMPET